MKKRLPYLVVSLLVAGIYLLGGFSGLERTLADFRFRFLTHDASGELVLLELPAPPKSAAGYAALLDRLLAAGVRRVVFDLLLGPVGPGEGGRSLARSLERAGDRVVLAVEKERLPAGWIPPSEEARSGVAHAASGIYPDSDGRVRRMPSEVEINGRRLRTVPVALLAGAQPPRESFGIDFGLRLASLPRITSEAILRGEVAEGSLANKAVLVALAGRGERFEIPSGASVTAPLVHAVAYETLVQGRALREAGRSLTVAVAVILALLAGPALGRLAPGPRLAAAAGGGAAMYLGAILVQATTSLAFEVVPWIATLILSCGVGTVRKALQPALAAGERRDNPPADAAARRRALLGSVMEDSFDGIVIVGPNGRIEVMNRSAGRILGYEPGEAIGRTLDDVLPDLRRYMESGDATAEEGDEAAAPVEVIVRRKDGSPIVVELLLSRSVADDGEELRTESRQVYAFIFRDVTARRRAQEMQEVAARMAMSASRAKSEFLANMSHELRTPLNAIIGFADVIRRQAFGRVTPERYLDYVNDIYHSSQHLLGLINDILDLSKVESGRLEPQEEVLDLTEVFDACLRIVGGEESTNEVNLVTDIADDMPGLYADRRMVMQIVLNLLTNAVKFTDPGGTVSLKARMDLKGRLVVEVIDTGIGIDAEHLPYVTQPFYQAHEPAQGTFSGTGLGLALVSGYVEMHGGTLEIQSEVNIGTTVRILFPPERVVEGVGLRRAN